MQPSSHLRQIRLLIEEGALSEALTEMLICLRNFKARGMKVDEFLAERDRLAQLGQGAAFRQGVPQLHKDMEDEWKRWVKRQNEAAEETKSKGGIFSGIGSILGSLFGKAKTSRSEDFPSSSPRIPHIPKDIPAEEMPPPKKQSPQKSQNEEPKPEPEPEPPEEMMPVEEMPSEEEWQMSEPPEEMSSASPADDEGWGMSEPPEEMIEEEEKEDEPQARSPKPKLPPSTHAQKQIPEEDIVNISVFSPEHVAAGSRFLLSAFAHLFEQKEAVAAMAVAADPAASIQVAKSLNMPIPRGGQLTFRLTIEDWSIVDSVQTLSWLGQPSSVEFIIRVPKDYAEETAFGSLLVIGAEQEVGSMKFNLRIRKGQAAPAESGLVPVESRKVRQVFLSYAQGNQGEVDKFSQKMSDRGIQILDPWKMEGDNWKMKVRQALSDSELFYLFWSHEAAESTEVDQSCLMALGNRFNSKHRLPDMLPVLLDDPAPDPPKRLAFLNFVHTKPPLNPEENLWKPGSVEELKSKAEALTWKKDPEIFTLLEGQFQDDTDVLKALLLLKSESLSLEEEEMMGMLTQEETRVRQNKITNRILSIIAQLA